MRPRTELALGLAVFLSFVLLAFGAGMRKRGTVATDTRASSLVFSPSGTRALAEVVERSGGRVTRWRQRVQLLSDSIAGGATVVLAQPAVPLTVNDALALLALTEGTSHLLVAGVGAQTIYRCLGYELDFSFLDSARVLGSSGVVRRRVASTFRTDTDTARTMSSGLIERVSCPDVPVASVDTLLRTDADEPVVLRLHRSDSDNAILLLSDAVLISNAGLATVELPEVLVREVLALSDHVVFDEYHQFGASGSLWRATLQWTRASPWGWMVWQLAIVGLLLFLFGAVRFGPVRRSIPRERRSPLEHVRALATALAASNGHDVAIASLVRGLHRRLAAVGGESRGGRARPPRAAWHPWVDQLARRIPDPEVRERAARLSMYAAPGQPDTAVRAAANAVEDVWEALHR
ncbi:MAG: DUF4350 domain-containing protein [Gemmatimonadaceae bacterium]